MFPLLTLQHPVYAIGLAVSVAVGGCVMIAALRRTGVPAWRFAPFMIVLLVGSAATAKVASFLFRGEIGSIDVELAGGMRYPGSIVGLILFGWLARRLVPKPMRLLQFADVVTPGYLVMLAMGRLNCFVVGCCHGSLSELPWAIRFPRGSIPWFSHYDAGLIPPDAPHSLGVHPFQLYLFLMEAALAFFAARLGKRGWADGRIFWTALCVHGILKACLEFLREPYSVFHQSVLLLSVLAAFVLLSSVASRDSSKNYSPLSS